jgi:hypothetical protein
MRPSLKAVRNRPTKPNAQLCQKVWIIDEMKSLSEQLLLWGPCVAQIVCLERAACVRAHESGRRVFHVEAGCEAASTGCGGGRIALRKAFPATHTIRSQHCAVLAILLMVGSYIPRKIVEVELTVARSHC